jgi:antitoxin (DNA-binding transcriptional repressor) of toxin-antitoxin stability system
VEILKGKGEFTKSSAIGIVDCDTMSLDWSVVIMSKNLGVAEAKKRFSELVGRIVHKGERFIVERKGKPVMAMVSLEDLQKLEQIPGKKMSKGVLAAIGAWEDFENLDEVVVEIYRARAEARDRIMGGLE